MPITLLHGPAGGEKTNFLLRHLFSRHGSEGYADSFFLIVPTARSVAFYQQKFLQTDLAGQIFTGDVIVPFERFLLRLLKQNLPRLHQSTSRINRNIIRKLLSNKEYKTFKKGGNFFGIVEELAETLIRFKKSGLSALSARRHLERYMTSELDDLLRLFEDYNQALKEIYYYDEGDLYAETLKLLRTNHLKLPEKLKGIYIDRIFPLTLCQREIIRELGRLFPHLDIVVSYSFDYQAGEDPYFYPAYSFLGELASENEYFHCTKTEKKVSLHSFTDPAAEILWLAGQIGEKLQKGIPPDRLGVILPPDSFYHRRLVQLLAQASIPCSPPYAPFLSRFFTLATQKPDDLVSAFLEMPMLAMAESLSALAEIEKFNGQWEFEKNLLFKTDFASDTKAKWRRDELLRIRLEPLSATGGVPLLTAKEALARDFDVLFVSGYVDGYYPSPLSEHPFYPTEALVDPLLREILEGPAYRHGVEKYRLEQAIDRTATEVILTHPKILWNGKEVSVSSLIEVETENSKIPPSEFNNQVSPPSPLPVFPKLRRNQFSVSEIEAYLKCPYQYYARYHLKLGELKEEETDVPPHVRGNFLHRILQKLYADNRDLFRDAVEYDLYLNRLIEKASLLIDQEKKTDAFLRQAPEMIREPFCARLRAVVSAFLRDETALIREKQKKTRPAYFEWAFGSGGVPPLRLKHGEILLTGRIDRIDVDPEQKIFTVIDYKTGENDTTAGIKNGESIQIPVYLMAVQKNLLKDHRPSGGFLLGFKELKISGICLAGRGDEAMLKKNAQITEAEWQTLQEIVTNRIAEVVHRINEGKFNPNPAKVSECRFCDYRDVCHYEQKGEEEE